MKKNSVNKACLSKLTIFWLVLFVAAFLFLIWKAPYGFGGDDEGFYLTVPHRLVLGDRLFSDEWHLSMLSSFFTYPFVALYLRVFGGTEGIMLFFRCLYVVLHALVSAFVFLRLRKYGFAALFASIMLMLFTPLGMMTLSYNTLAIDFLALAGVLLGSCGEEDKAAHFFSGCFFACAVVCCPYLAFSYLFYLLALPVSVALKKCGHQDRSGLFNLASFLSFSLGIAVPFVLFLIFFLRHSGISDVIDNLRGIFSDPEHPSQSLFFKFKRYFYCLLTAHRFIALPLGLYAVSVAALVFDRKRERHTVFYLFVSCLVAIICWLLFVPELKETYFNGFILPLVFPGFMSYLLLKERPVRVFVSLFVTGLIYSFCVCATSNMGFIVLSMAFIVVNLSSTIFIVLLLRQLKEECGALPTAARVSVALSFAVLALMLVYVKAEYCFWDMSPQKLESRIEVGPARGIITSEGAKLSYEALCADLEYYNDKEPDDILMYTQSAWTYLILEDYPYAAFSAWLSGLTEETEARLAFYYSENPDKYPRYVCVPKPSAFGELFYTREEIMASAEKYGFSFEESDTSYKLEKKPDIPAID